MAVGRGLPLEPLPLDWDENPRTWAGKPARAADTFDMPIAYWRDRLVAMHPSVQIYYVGTQAPAPGIPIRVPCVLMCSQEKAEELLVSYQEEVDRLGMVICSITPAPWTEDETMDRFMLSGLPIVENESNPAAPQPKGLATYHGGRLLVFHEDVTFGIPTNGAGTSGGRYAQTTIDPVGEEYTAPAGSDAQCSAIAGHLIAGTDDLETILTPPPGVDLIIDDVFSDNIAEDNDFLRSAPFEKLKIVVRLRQNVDEFEEWEVDRPITCFDTLGGGNTTVDSGETTTGNNSAALATALNLRETILGGFDPSIVVNGQTFGLQDIIDFFEED